MPSYSDDYPQILLIGGPTSSGKSDLALEVARRCSGIVINADSMQLYREIPILSGQPDAQAMQGAPHKLYGVLGVAEQASAASWLKLVMAEVEAALQNNLRPILVGGTGLYLKSFIEGLSDIPDIDPAITARAEEMLREKGVAFLYAELQRDDPAMAAILKPNDWQRIFRALTVRWGTGKSLLEFQGQKSPSHRYRVKLVTLLPDRAELHRRIEARFDAMVKGGALDEVARIEAMGVKDNVTALKAKGIPELRRHLRGELTLEEASTIAKAKTRQYAKRQYTWFRNQMKPDIVIDHVATAKDAASILS